MVSSRLSQLELVVQPLFPSLIKTQFLTISVVSEILRGGHGKEKKDCYVVLERETEMGLP